VKKKLFAAGLVTCTLAAICLAQHPLQKPGSAQVEISSPIVIPTAPSAATAPNPLGTQVRIGARSVLVLKVNSAPTGGSGQTLDVYFQNSADDGQTWQDFAEIHATATGTFYIPVSAIAAGPTSSLAVIQDGAKSNNTANQGPIGDRVRTKFNANLGTGTSGIWSYHAFVVPGGEYQQ
jgi:hypothetical protein